MLWYLPCKDKPSCLPTDRTKYKPINSPVKLIAAIVLDYSEIHFRINIAAPHCFLCKLWTSMKRIHKYCGETLREIFSYNFAERERENYWTRLHSLSQPVCQAGKENSGEKYNLCRIPGSCPGLFWYWERFACWEMWLQTGQDDEQWSNKSRYSDIFPINSLPAALCSHTAVRIGGRQPRRENKDQAGSTFLTR